MDFWTDQDFKKIIARRDRRFDGRFYFGVKTTRIYCRPGCPAKPKPENILIFKSASEAERNGYRACLRCRPDVAPGSKLLDGTMNTVSRALRIIGESTNDDLTVEKLAEVLGVTGRHLRRLFDEHLGASPIEIISTNRLHFAKQILQASRMSVIDIAFASGFQSVRRFNEAFKSRFHVAPSVFRKSFKNEAVDALQLKIPIRLPFDWDYVLSYLKGHESFGIENIADREYRRFIPIQNSYGSVIVARQKEKEFLSIKFLDIPVGSVRSILSRIKFLFDTDHNPVHLPPNELVSQGIRVPGCFDPFETAIAIILGQLVSISHARTNLKNVIQQFGVKIGEENSQEIYAFPTAETLSKAPIEQLGITRSKAQTIRDFSQAVVSKSINFTSHIDFSEAVKRLRTIKGIGPWTSSMIAMRCLGDPDAFPEFDLIIQRAIEKKIADPSVWMSSRAYLTHCLWRDYASALSKVKNKKGTS